MALFQSAGRVPLFTGMSSNRARYGRLPHQVLVFLQKYRLALLIGFFFGRCYPFPNDFSINGEGYA